MLPLAENDLSSDDDWHILKCLLVICRHCDPEAATEAYESLSKELKFHRHGKAVRSFLDSGDSQHINASACELAQRSLPEAWLLLERC